MDMHAAYKELGSYRAAAELCGTTDKTVRRGVVRGHEKVPGYGHEKSPLVATGSPRWWPAEVPTPH